MSTINYMKKYSGKRKGIFQSMSLSQKIVLFFLLFLLIAIPITVLISLQRTTFPSQAKVSQLFSIPTPAPSFGKAVLLNGTDSFAEIENSENLDPQFGYTIEAWVKLNKFNPQASPDLGMENIYTVFGKGGYPPEMRLWMTVAPQGRNKFNINYFFDVSDKGRYPNSPQACYQGRGIDVMASNVLTGSNQDVLKWRHLAGVIQPNGIMEVYVDGKKFAYSPKLNQVCPNTLNSKIGAVTLSSGFSPAQTKFLWDGLIDELRISNVARYSTNFVPQKIPFIPDANTAALYHFDNNLLDASGNNYHGLTTGGVTFVNNTLK